MRYVILGNGIAGTQAAEAIRSLDPDGPLTVVAREPHLPYCRPMIASVLAGHSAVADLPVRKDSFYERLGIDVILGEGAAAVQLDSSEVLTEGGRTIPFDRLLIATGSDARTVPAAEAAAAELDGIFYMRTLKHVESMVRILPEAGEGTGSALVLGGGLVGFKAAYGLLHRGFRVVMLIKSGYPLFMQVDAEAGRLIQEELEKKGLEVRTGVEAVGFEGEGRVEAARLSDGSMLSCSLVVVGKGVVPAMGFLPTEIETHAGVVGAEYLETTVPGSYAAGDVAESVDGARDKPWVNAIWPVAVEQGRHAGWNMAGRPVAYPGSLSRNVIRIFDLDVLTAGVVNPDEGEGYEAQVHYDPRRRLYRKLVTKEGRLAGVVLLNGIEQGGVLMNMVADRRPFTAPVERFFDGSFNFGLVSGRVG